VDLNFFRDYTKFENPERIEVESAPVE